MTEYAGILMIKLIGGKNLPAADLNGTSDPYCVFKCGQQVVKSSVVEKSLSPYWGEKITLCVPSLKEPVSLNVWDKDRVTDDFLGCAVINASDLKEDETKSLVVQLEEKSTDKPEDHHQHKSPKKEKKKECGEIHIELSFQSLTH